MGRATESMTGEVGQKVLPTEERSYAVAAATTVAVEGETDG